MGNSMTSVNKRYGRSAARDQGFIRFLRLRRTNITINAMSATNAINPINGMIRMATPGPSRKYIVVVFGEYSNITIYPDPASE